jgi:hypothetical protein
MLNIKITVSITLDTKTLFKFIHILVLALN